mmetsp:Transcript_9637/g.26093  ORF Transcript_9637/g.26093 Transcript_9637/m.26093 type:complete len:252 (-) Transcript_9637:232-987(-)
MVPHQPHHVMILRVLHLRQHAGATAEAPQLIHVDVSIHQAVGKELLRVHLRLEMQCHLLAVENVRKRNEAAKLGPQVRLELGHSLYEESMVVLGDDAVVRAAHVLDAEVVEREAGHLRPTRVRAVSGHADVPLLHRDRQLEVFGHVFANHVLEGLVEAGRGVGVDGVPEDFRVLREVYLAIVRLTTQVDHWALAGEIRDEVHKLVAIEALRIELLRAVVGSSDDGHTTSPHLPEEVLHENRLRDVGDKQLV